MYTRELVNFPSVSPLSEAPKKKLTTFWHNFPPDRLLVFPFTGLPGQFSLLAQSVHNDHHHHQRAGRHQGVEKRAFPPRVHSAPMDRTRLRKVFPFSRAPGQEFSTGTSVPSSLAGSLPSENRSPRYLSPARAEKPAVGKSHRTGSTFSWHARLAATFPAHPHNVYICALSKLRV